VLDNYFKGFLTAQATKHQLSVSSLLKSQLVTGKSSLHIPLLKARIVPEPLTM